MQTIGKSIPILDARDKVTGRAIYTDDLKSDLFIKILGSPHAHARVKSIDVAEAMKLPGVMALLTHEDVAHRKIPFGTYGACYPIDNHLRHLGDYVAAVAATSEAVAEQALELIKVDYEILPAVFEVEDAISDGACKLHPGGNVHEPSLQEWGDIDAGFNDAAVTVEDQFDVTPQVHTPMEPHACMAHWNGSELTIWCSVQTPWELRDIAANYLEISESKVTVIVPTIGGGFGGKYTGRYQIIVVMLATKARGKRVKLNFTREEEQYYSRRVRGKIWARAGATADGVLTAFQLRGYFDVGAYLRHYATWCSSIGYGINSYRVPNARFESFSVHTNTCHAQAMRSVSAPFFAFPMEAIMDQLAEKLDIDPVEIRLRNLPKTGDMVPPVPYVHNSGGCKVSQIDAYPAQKMLMQTAEAMNWKGQWNGAGKPTAVEGTKRRGIGLAYMMMHAGYCWESVASIQIVINRDGSAIVHSGAQEIGEGINTGLCMLAAESLGISMKDVSIVTADTRTGQYDAIGAKASRQLATHGHLLLKAIEEAKRKVRERVAAVWDVTPDQIVLAGKRAYIKGRPGETRPLRDLLKTSVTGNAEGEPGDWLPDVKPGFRPFHPVVIAAEVEVDVETGDVRPVRVVPAMFPRRMINPGMVRGQSIGGAAMTLGMALWEEVKYDENTQTYFSKDLTDYRIPRSLDIPEIESILMEELDEEMPPHEGLPYGAAGLGEHAAWGGPAAIANAVYNAIGVRVNSSPITAEKVIEALARRRDNESSTVLASDKV